MNIRTNSRKKSALIFLWVAAASLAPAVLAAETVLTDTAPAEDEKPEARQAPPPEVTITPFGDEYNIQVKYPHPMDFEKGDYMEYIRMETAEGESLGIKAFNEGSTEASVEFMLNAKLAGFDSFRLVASSKSLGLIESTHELKPTPPPQAAQTLSPAAPPGKKKLFGFLEI